MAKLHLEKAIPCLTLANLGVNYFIFFIPSSWHPDYGYSKGFWKANTTGRHYSIHFRLSFGKRKQGGAAAM